MPVMLAHLLIIGLRFDWNPADNMYVPVGEGQENHVYAYLEYVGKTKDDVEDLGVWDRLSVHVSQCTRFWSCVCFAI